MFFFRKSKRDVPTNLSWLGTDLHSHLLPGIDDGVPAMETSLAMIKGLHQLGYKKLITTPHILWEIYPNTLERIKAKEQQVQAAIATAGINIEFTAAAEYFIDEHFQKSIRQKAPLLCIKNNIVLVEFSMVTAPLDLMDVLFDMQLQGYQPLVAHPERYIYLTRRKAFFADLKAAGCQFQLNLLSLTPHYGTSVQALAEYLLKENLYDYAGTDLHGEKHLLALQQLAAAPLYNQLIDSGQLKNHLL